MPGRDTFTSWDGTEIVYWTWGEPTDSPPVVHFEHFSSGAFVPDGDNVNDYFHVVSKLKGLAVGPGESPAFIAKIAEEWRRKS